MPGFAREQWTTSYIGRLVVGDIFGAHLESPLQPAVLTAITIKPVHGQWAQVIGTAQRLRSGEVFTFECRANTTVVVRCDLRCTAKAPLSSEGVVTL
ncbi:hypothetical protein [Streptomyces sp. NBC_00338]|uniref:hypothetical protein n=1 Tax=Streptomyces sp. NBC_00338 TaxID=2975715 RepID=UPI0022565E93|nr:hypothetical protein [Streptomyces sp. NBC_00338]MCX5145104.1 hypothetical protein [Streptomyces sp. NBC_00338]